MSDGQPRKYPYELPAGLVCRWEDPAFVRLVNPESGEMSVMLLPERRSSVKPVNPDKRRNVRYVFAPKTQRLSNRSTPKAG